MALTNIKDARIYQIVSLALFLIMGIGTRDWSLKPGMIGVAIATCIMTQGGILAIQQGWFQFRSASNSPLMNPPWLSPNLSDNPDKPTLNQLFNTLPSALITALGLSLLLRADHYSTMVLAGSVAILSKFVLQVRGKHVFNPGNFGIIVALLLTHDAWVSPGQWGEESWYALVFLGCGGLVLQKVGRWDTTVAFLVAYGGLEALRNIWLGWTWDVWGHRLMSGSLLLFALFMVTDPRTIPNARIARVIWAIAIAVLTFILRNYFFLSTAVFWSLFALAPLSIGLDWLFPASRFQWIEPPKPDSSGTSPSPVVALSDSSLLITPPL